MHQTEIYNRDQIHRYTYLIKSVKAILEELRCIGVDIRRKTAQKIIALILAYIKVLHRLPSFSRGNAEPNRVVMPDADLNMIDDCLMMASQSAAAPALTPDLADVTIEF